MIRVLLVNIRMSEYFVYILISQKDGNLYVGCSTDFKKRLLRHNRGLVPSTKSRKPFDVLYVERYSDKGEAFQRERFLKSLWSARFKHKLKEDYWAKP